MIDLVLIEMLCRCGFQPSINFRERFAERGQVEKTTHNTLIVTKKQEVQSSQDSDSEIEFAPNEAIVSTPHSGVVGGGKEFESKR